MFIDRKQIHILCSPGSSTPRDGSGFSGYVLYHAPCTVMEVAAGTGTSKGHVSRFLPFLVSRGLLARDGRRFHRVDGPFTRSVKVLLNLESLLPAVPLPDWADGIGVYGSWAEGTNTDESDLDLWVLAEGYPGEVQAGELIASVSAALGTEIHVLFLTREKLAGPGPGTSHSTTRSRGHRSRSGGKTLFTLEECFGKALLRRVDPSTGKARESLRQARTWLAEAEQAFAAGVFRSALLAAYNAYFHAARAILFRDGLREKSHSCIETLPWILRERGSP